MKHWTKALLLTLCLALCAGFFCLGALAEEAPALDGAVVASGEGWSLESDGTLTVTATSRVFTPAWDSYKNRIKTVNVAEGVTALWCDFSSYPALTTISLPSSFTDTVLYFNGCVSLTDIYVADDNPSYASVDGVLFDRGKTSIIRYPSGRTGVYTVPDSVTSIGSSAFENCTGITRVNFPGSVATIGQSAFRGCTGLESLSLPSGLKTLGSYAFYGCKGLTSVTIPGGVTTIGESAFSNCTSLTSAVVEEGVISLPNYLFSTSSLQCLTLPSSLWTLGNNITGSYSEYETSAFTDVYFAGSESDWESLGIVNNDKLLNARIHYNGERPASGWAEANAGWVYYYADGTHAVDQQQIAGKTYRFDKAGVMQTGWYDVYKDGAYQYYYFDPSSGAMAVGWKKIAVSDNETTVDYWYYFGADGVRQTGWQNIDGKTYYFEKYDGRMYADQWLYINDNYYYFDANGAMLTGWQKIGDYWYYLGADGVRQTGWQNIDGKTYYFESNGLMYADQWLYEETDEGTLQKTAYFTSSGVMAIGWQKITAVNGPRDVAGISGSVQATDWYYFDNNGHYKTGWQSIGGKWYYFLSGGQMVADGVLNLDDGTYGFTASGAMATGWQKITYRTMGAAPAVAGGVGYASVTDWSYFSGSGKYVTGWQKIDNVWYYFLDDGRMVADGVYPTGSGTYYFYPSGAMRSAGGWVSSGGAWYYLNNGGAAVTDWQAIGGKWYYFNADGRMNTGWRQLDRVWYYFQSGGAMSIGWQKIDGSWYFFRSSGAMVTGWYQDGANWYYFKEGGAMACNETIDKYTFNASGVWVS